MHLKTDNVDYCQMLQTLFWVFQYSTQGVFHFDKGSLANSGIYWPIFLIMYKDIMRNQPCINGIPADSAESAMEWLYRPVHDPYF